MMDEVGTQSAFYSLQYSTTHLIDSDLIHAQSVNRTTG